MSEKHSEESFDFKEFKNQLNQIKEASKQAKEMHQEKIEGEMIKQSLGKKLLGIIILIAIVAGVIFVIISNFETILLPKNSITINVADQNGEVVNGLKIQIQVNSEIQEFEFIDTTSITMLDAKPGEYTIVFEEVPEGYSCSELVDNFTLNQDGKVRLEYECIKEY